MKPLEKQALLADRAAVAAMLGHIPHEDLLGRMSFEARLNDIDGQLHALEAAPTHTGEVALIFRGQPVFGAHSIDTAFASDALKSFQDIVSKRIAVSELGELGERGPLPERFRANLGISQMVRGSVGFVLEEQSDNAALADTVVKSAIVDVADLIEKTASEDEGKFDEAVQALDARLLISLRNFFRTIDDGHAEFRLVEQEREADISAPDIKRARDRLDSTEIEDRGDQIVLGELIGLLPERRRFEMRLAEGRQLIGGPVTEACAEHYLELIEQQQGAIVGRWWNALMRIREIRERNKPVRHVYTLVRLAEEAQAPHGGDW